MVELTDEEEAFLDKLCRVEKDGNDVGEFISNRLENELSRYEYDNGESGVIFMGPIVHREPGYEHELSICKGLARKGMISSKSINSRLAFEGLTSDGRRYFAMSKAALTAAHKAKWSERRFAIFMSLLSFALGLIASWLIAHQAVDSALQPLLGS